MGLAILCPGQSSQSPDVLGPIRGQPDAEAVFAAFAAEMGHEIQDVLADAELLFSNRYAQPIICAIEMAYYFCLNSRVPAPDLFAGYSVGELAAYGCAGAISPSNVIRLAKVRAELMDAASNATGGMVAVRGLDERALDILSAPEGVHIAIRNGADRFVVGGEKEALKRFQKAAEPRGGSVTWLAVNVASHTPLMAKAAEQFRGILDGIGFSQPQAPIVAGVDGSSVISRQHAVSSLSQQLCRRVDWASCMIEMAERGCLLQMELPPGNSLSHMSREANPMVIARSIVDFRGLDGAGSWLNRQWENWR